jgi:hypothetical protein
MFFIWMERKFQEASNGTSFRPKFIRSRRKSSAQVDIQNLFWCCNAVFWSFGPCIVSGPIRGASKGSCTTLETILAAATFLLGFGFCLSYSVKNSSPIDRLVRLQLECLINHLQFSRLCSSLFLFVSLIRRQGLALVARSIVQRLVDNQRRSGAAIAGFESC